MLSIEMKFYEADTFFLLIIIKSTAHICIFINHLKFCRYPRKQRSLNGNRQQYLSLIHISRYAVVQTYFWGCLAGYEREWDVLEDTMKKLEWAIGDGRVLSLFHEMQNAVENGLNEYESGGGNSLPDWNGRKQNMVLKDGHYELTLDLSSSFYQGTASLHPLVSHRS